MLAVNTVPTPSPGAREAFHVLARQNRKRLKEVGRRITILERDLDTMVRRHGKGARVCERISESLDALYREQADLEHRSMEIVELRKSGFMTL